MGLYKEEKLVENRDIIEPFLLSLEKRQIRNDGNKDDEWHPILWYRKEDGYAVPLIGKGELMVIAGEKKSRKSLLVNILAASRFVQDLELTRETTLGFELALDEPILYFDTEQPRRRVYKNRKRYQQMINDPEGDDPDFIQYSLKGMSAHQMIKSISYVIEKMVSEGRKPGWIIIDQIVDLVTSRDENDKASGSEVLDCMNSWQDITGALITAMIHTNRAGQQTNGKVGGLLDQKTDCTFRLNTIDKTWETELTHLFSREKKMPNIKFNQDYITGLPQFINETPQSYGN